MLPTQFAASGHGASPPIPHRLTMLPGMPWVITGLSVLFIVGIRKILFHYGINFPLRLISLVGNSLGVVLLVLGTYRFGKTQDTSVLLRPKHLMAIYSWRILLIAMFCYGLYRGNPWNDVGNEFVILWIFSSLLIVGGDDRFWFAIEKPLTVIFYLAAVLIYLFYDTPAPITTIDGTIENQAGYMDTRYIMSLAMDFSAFTGAGIFLGIWGAICPRKTSWDRWRVLQILAFFVVTAIQVGVFKFRGAVIVSSGAVLSLLLIRPFFEQRRRPGLTAMLLALALVGILVFLATEASQTLKERWAENTVVAEQSIFTSRNVELADYLSDIKDEIFIGRGLGGYFNAYNAIGIEAAMKWGVLHYGLMIFTLKGGILMLLLFLGFLVPGFYLRPKYWYQNPCNMVAALMFPILMFQFIMGPFMLIPGAIMIYLPAMIVLARFGRHTDVDAPTGSPVEMRGVHRRNVFGTTLPRQ